MLNPHPTLRRSDLFSGVHNDLDMLSGQDSLYLTYNARGAFHQLLQAIPANKGDIVLLPAFHCTALIEPVAHSRFRAVFYRIKPDLSIDLDDLRSKTNSDIAVIVAIHFFGFPTNLEPLTQLCRKFGCYLLEDCAHSFLTLDEGKPIGYRADFSVYSFYKIVPSLFGGALRINRKPFEFTASKSRISLRDSAVITKRLLEQMIENSNDGFWKRTYQFLENRRVARKKTPLTPDQPTASSFVDDPYIFRSHLAQARMPRFCQRILNSSNWQAIMTARRRNFEVLNRALQETSALRKVCAFLPEGICPWAYPVLLRNRINFEQALRARGVPLFTFGEVLHPLLLDADPLVRKDAEDLSSQLMALPIHQNLSVDEVSQYADEINRLLPLLQRASAESDCSMITPHPASMGGF